jgi:hypothetical protein
MMDLTMPTDEATDDVDAVESHPSADRPLSRWRALLEPTSHLLTYAGIVLLLAGFGLIALAWSQVAGETEVWKQMPYLVSAGFPGLGLIMTGLLAINISAKRQDAAERARQLETLTDALHELKRRVDEDGK